jgi:DNA polymerase III delta subunit
MTNENIVKRLRDEADKASLRVDDTLANLLNEAAEEIENLYLACHEINRLWQEYTQEAP